MYVMKHARLSFFLSCSSCLCVFFFAFSRDSYNHLMNWLADARSLARADISIIAVGKKLLFSLFLFITLLSLFGCTYTHTLAFYLTAFFFLHAKGSLFSPPLRTRRLLQHHMYVCPYMYIHIYRACKCTHACRLKERERARQRCVCMCCCFDTCAGITPMCSVHGHVYT